MIPFIRTINPGGNANLQILLNMILERGMICRAQPFQENQDFGGLHFAHSESLPVYMYLLLSNMYVNFDNSCLYMNKNHTV